MIREGDWGEGGSVIKTSCLDFSNMIKFLKVYANRMLSDISSQAIANSLTSQSSKQIVYL